MGVDGEQVNVLTRSEGHRKGGYAWLCLFDNCLQHNMYSGDGNMSIKEALQLANQLGFEVYVVENKKELSELLSHE